MREKLIEAPKEQSVGPSSGTATATVSPATGTEPAHTEARLHPVGFHNGIDSVPPEVPDASVTYVTADEGRAERIDAALEAREFKNGLLQDVTTVTVQPTRNHLAAVLERDTSFLVCDLPNAGGGIVCSDGTLDPRSVDTGVGIAAVSGPRLADTPAAMIDAGATGVLATTRPLPIAGLVDLTAVLLSGHPIGTAPDIAGIDAELSAFVLGNPIREVAVQQGTQTAHLVDVVGPAAGTDIEDRSAGSDKYEIALQVACSSRFTPGGVTMFLEDYSPELYQLTGSTQRPAPVSDAQLAEILSDDLKVVRLNGETRHALGEVSPGLARELIAQTSRADAELNP